MKSKPLALLLCALLTFPHLSQASPLPEDMLPAEQFVFPPDEKYEVFSGPGQEYVRLGDGKASVSTNDWIDVFGYENGYLMVRYALSENRTRIGWISHQEAGDFTAPDLVFSWKWQYMRTCCEVALTDDPFESQEEAARLPAGTAVYFLSAFDGWAYIDTSLTQSPSMRGFVPLDSLETAAVPYETVPAFASAVSFLAGTGIEFTVAGMRDNNLYISLQNGGSASYYYLSNGYSVYEMCNWRFQNISDEDAALFLDANLKVLCQVEQGLAPEEHLKPDYHEDEGLGQWNIQAVVSNGLLYLESLGRQGLDILLYQLSLHDGDDLLNSMRSRLASRMLGKLDITPVDSSLGCAWYDALTLSVQDALPPVDASTYVDDPLLCQATQALIAYFDEKKVSWAGWLDVDGEKTRNLVSLSVHKMEESENRLILWANVNESQFALYDGYRAQALSGSWIPSRITLAKDEQGRWILQELLQAEDGSRYAPSIIAFCDGDEDLANEMMQDDSRDLWKCFETYLAANGYGAIEEIPY